MSYNRSFASILSMGGAGPLGRIWYLKKVDLFKGMSHEEMAHLAQVTQDKQFRRKDIIYLPGQPGRHVYLLKKGIVKISRINPEGRELALALLKPGEIFGELEALEDVARDSKAEAHSDAMICVLGKNDLMDMIQRRPALGIHLSRLIGFRRRVIENRLENLIFRTTPQKLARLLLELGEKFGQKSAQGILITIALPHHDLANLIGAARATVTEALMKFRQGGLLDVLGKRITILNPSRLKVIGS